MKRFILRTIYLLGGLILSIALLLILVIVGDNSKKVVTNPINLIVGDSHMETSLDPSLIDYSYLNYSSSSESTFYSYYKVLNLINNDYKIKNLYLGLSYHNISSYYDETIDGNLSSRISSRYFRILPFKKKISSLNYNKRDIFKYVRNLIEIQIRNIATCNKTYYGEFHNKFYDTQVDSTVVDSRIKSQFYDSNNEILSFSNINIEYLHKLKQLCDNNKINLFLVKTPLHSLYLERIPERYVTKYKEIEEELKVPVIDFESVLVENHHFTPDGDHLSLKGAHILSTEFKMITNQ